MFGVKILRSILLSLFAVLFFGGCAAAIFYYSTMKDMAKFSWDDNGTVTGRGFQRNTPTPDELKAGYIALSRWKTSSEWQRFFLSRDLVLGKVLIGLNSEDLFQILGEPFAKRTDQAYYVTSPKFFASQWDLYVTLRNEKVVDAYVVADF